MVEDRLVPVSVMSHVSQEFDRRWLASARYGIIIACILTGKISYSKCSQYNHSVSAHQLALTPQITGLGPTKTKEKKAIGRLIVGATRRIVKTGGTERTKVKE